MGQPRELRYAAAQAFIESLEHLQHTLEPMEKAAAALPISVCETASPLGSSANSSPEFDLAALEDAIADIEQFIQHQTREDQRT
jgi:hypothetical protein